MRVKKEKSDNIKIFVGYHEEHPIFKTDVYQPILTANADWNHPDVIKDNMGDNISDKNKNYAELTGHYWVWKNFLPKHKEIKYVGFCHYRRFLDFDFTKTEALPFQPIMHDEFQELFKNYTQENILKFIGDYDVILPRPLPFIATVYDQYLKWHPRKDWDLSLLTIKQLYPEYVPETMEFISGHSMHTCINFIMKTELFEEFEQWLFSILFNLETICNWEEYDEYLTVRTPAYITERIFNIWLMHNIKEKGLKVKITDSLMIVGEGYGDKSAEEYIDIYNSLINYLKNNDVI